MTINMLFPDLCPDCEHIDKCGEDCFCPTCRAEYYGRPVNSVELEAWTLLAPAMRAIDARWRTNTSGPLCSFASAGKHLRDYEIDINSKHKTYTITTDGVNVSVEWIDCEWREGGYIDGATYPLSESWKVAQDVDL